MNFLEDILKDLSFQIRLQFKRLEITPYQCQHEKYIY